MSDHDNPGPADNGSPEPDDDEIIEGEIVGREPTRSPDVILAPCHHGCTCGLHMQVVYGERVPEHDPDVLDHGEMGLLTEAAERAAHRADEFHDYLAKLREVVEQTYGRARKAIDDFEILLHQRGPDQAARDRLEDEAAALTPAQREPAPWWLKAAAVAAAVSVAIFDAYFFQQTFLNILAIRRDAPFWERDIGLVAAAVFALGVIASGRILCGPIWRLTQKWQRQASPDDRPPGRATVSFRVTAVVAAPAAILFVLGWWASLRGQITAQTLAANAAGGSAPAPVLIPSAVPVMLLLLSLALTVIVLEVLVYNPYRAAVRNDEKRIHRLVKAGRAATDALTVLEVAWRDLRSTQDEVIGLIQTELARPWHTTILPARLRHGRAGPKPVPPGDGTEIRIMPSPAGDSAAGIEQVQISYQLFAGIQQPQPGPGPLAETVRSVVTLDPGGLQTRLRELQQVLFAIVDKRPVEAQ